MMRHIGSDVNSWASRIAWCCPRCRSTDLERRPAPHPHSAELWCRCCNRHVRWIGKPRDLAEASAFVMPFGPCKGTPMGRLSDADLEWLAKADGIRGRIRKFAELIL